MNPSECIITVAKKSPEWIITVAKIIACYLFINGVVMFIWWCSSVPIERSIILATVQSCVIVVTAIMSWVFDI